MKVFGENILDRYDILDPIPESKIFGKKGIPKERGEDEPVYSKGARCIIVLTIREREGMGPTILFERLFITY